MTQKIYVTGYINGELTEAQKAEVIDSLYSMRKEYLYDDEKDEFSADIWVLTHGEMLPQGFQPPILVLSYDEKQDAEEKKEVLDQFQDFLTDSQQENLEIAPVHAASIGELTPEQLDAFIEYIRGRDGVHETRCTLERLGLIPEQK